MDTATETELPGLPGLTDLGIAAIPPARLDQLVSTAMGRPVRVTTFTVRPVDYPNGSITTDMLLRCAGSAVDAGGENLPWRMFVKVLRSARVWPFLHFLPEFARQQMIDEFPWRVEIDAYLSPIATLLDPGMRLPALYDVIEIDDDHAAIWMEDVARSTLTWDDDKFARAARHLGVLAGRRPIGTDVVFGPRHVATRPGYAMRMYAQAMLMSVAPRLRDPEVWRHPGLVAALAETGEVHLGADLVAALDRIESCLTAMDELPQTYVHGDASPQNLLVSVDDPDSFVIIDFGFNSPHCVGFDLGQLLVGLTHAGEVDASELDRIRRVIVPAYVDGLRATGCTATAAEVERGFLLATVVRTMFTAISLEILDRPAGPGQHQLLIQRIRLTRYLLTCMDEVCVPSGNEL